MINQGISGIRYNVAMSNSRQKILLFLFLTFLFSSIFYYLIASSGSIQTYALGLMWCPGIAALLTQGIFQRNLCGLGWRAGAGKYLLLGYALPIAYGLAVYAIVWLSGLGRFSPLEFANQVAAQLGMQSYSPWLVGSGYILALATIGISLSCLSALGEEIGWRGLLVPELAKETTFARTALISGGIWAVWHFPGILFADYNNANAPAWFGLICFTVMVLGISFPFAWLRLKSGSMWSSVILHASHNLFIQGVFTPLTSDTGVTAYVIDEFGIGLALISVLIAWLFWRRRSGLPIQGKMTLVQDQ